MQYEFKKYVSIYILFFEHLSTQTQLTQLLTFKTYRNMAKENENKDPKDPKNESNEENTQQPKKGWFRRILPWLGGAALIGGAAYGGYRVGYRKGRSVQQTNTNPNINH